VIVLAPPGNSTKAVCGQSRKRVDIESLGMFTTSFQAGPVFRCPLERSASRSPLLVRMHPLIRHDLLRLGQLDHVHRRPSRHDLHLNPSKTGASGRFSDDLPGQIFRPEAEP